MNAPAAKFASIPLQAAPIAMPIAAISRERRRLDAEVTQDADDEQDIERNIDRAADVAAHRRLDLLPLEGLPNQRADDADEPATDDVDRDGAQHLEAEGDEYRLRRARSCSRNPCPAPWM